MYNQLLGHCQLTNIPSEYFIYNLFAKLVAETPAYRQAGATNNTQNVLGLLTICF